MELKTQNLILLSDEMTEKQDNLVVQDIWVDEPEWTLWSLLKQDPDPWSGVVINGKTKFRYAI